MNSSKNQTAFVYDPSYLEHDTGRGHPERRERLEATMAHLDGQSWFNDLIKVAPRVAEREWIETTHASNYIGRVEEEIKRGVSHVDSPDVSVSEQSYDVALLATGAVLEVADKVMNGEVDNGFALVRPPGHHAEKSTALGFCLFNNAAIGARYIQQKYGVDKVMILDWGRAPRQWHTTYFRGRPVRFVCQHASVSFLSRYGAHSENGIGRGQGSTLNCPMAAGSTDGDYEQAFKEKILPKIDEFKPEVVMISAGFDAHHDDPLGQVNLSTEFYGWMSERMMEVADKHAGGRLVSMLEGGYDLDALSLCVAEHFASDDE